MPQGCWRGWSSTTIHQKHSNVPREIENCCCNLLNANRYCSYPFDEFAQNYFHAFCLWIPLHTYIYIFFSVPPTLVPKVSPSHDRSTRRFPPTALFNFFPQTDLMGCNGPSAPRPSNCHFLWSPPSFDSSCLSLILAGS